MRKIIFIALLGFATSASGQYSFDKNDFFEFGLVLKTISNSDYLAKSTYSTSLLAWADAGIKSKELGGIAVGMKYGKAFASFAHIVFDIEYAQYKIEAQSPVEYRETALETGDVLSLKALNIGFGPRFKIIGTEGFELSVEGGGKAFHTLNAGDDLVAGYYGRVIAGVNLNRRVQINAKYGYESTVGKYAATDLPAELALHFKIY